MNAHLPAKTLVNDFLLEQIAQQPLPRALMLYRSLAATTSDRDLACQCAAIADRLESVESAQRVLRLDLQRKAS